MMLRYNNSIGRISRAAVSPIRAALFRRSVIEGRRKGTVLAACLVLLAGGCSNAPSIGKISDSSVIVAFGDSLTAGTGVSKAESYPAVLGLKLGCRVVNAGISGELTSQAVLRLPNVLREHMPTLVILCEGGNDMLQQQADGVIRDNLQEMISLARKAGADVILIAVPRPGIVLRTPKFYKALAKDAGIPCDTSTLAEILSTPSLKSDSVHPNAAGYKRLAEAIAALISKAEHK